MSDRTVSPSPDDLVDRWCGSSRLHESLQLGYDPYFLACDAVHGARVRIRDRWYVMAGSVNYLGLTMHPAVQWAAKQAIHAWGTSSSGTRLLNGNSLPLDHLEQRLAAFLGTEAAAIFPSGFAANAAVITPLTDRDDIVIIDRTAHASLYKAYYLALGPTLRNVPQRLRSFSHNDIGDLERVLRGCPAHARKLVITDGIFAMTGDCAPIAEIAALCHTYGARVLVDESHAIGVLGDGRGATAASHAVSQVDFLTGSFSKALAAQGGFLAGNAALVQPLKYTARSMSLSAAIVPAATAAATAALEIVRTDPHRSETLLMSSRTFAEAIQALGYRVGMSGTPIIPLFFSTETEMLTYWRTLMDLGIYTNPIIPPAVPVGTGLLRIINTLVLTDALRAKILRALKRARRLLNE